MTGFASLFEFALVRILVTARTIRKLNAGIARKPISAESVALCTANVEMLSCQRVTRLCVIELLRIDFRSLPIHS
jgi:hypothetical protein